MTEQGVAQPVTVAITGASGAAYGLALIRELLVRGGRVDLLVSDAARQVLRLECAVDLGSEAPPAPDRLQAVLGVGPERLRAFGLMDWSAPVASGSSGSRKMVVCPCSMGTLAAISQGLADNLIRRAADVTLKEGGTLILVPRETPLSVIHLENMLRLSRAGAVILPAAPGFYHRPERVEDLVAFVVNRIITRLGLAGDPGLVWSGAGCAGG